jgi:hypothetical protein
MLPKKGDTLFTLWLVVGLMGGYLEGKYFVSSVFHVTGWTEPRMLAVSPALYLVPGSHVWSACT